MILGIIADDFTGATDVASMLVGAGVPTVQVLGVPSGDLPPAGAVVIALKTRTVAAKDAVDQSLRALQALRHAGARHVYFKYCSTFDSTPQGNIGPVTEALMRALGVEFTIACPALPANGRTVYQGHLFVGEQLLSDSGMREHPLTPMTDANLVRVLQAQTSLAVGLLPWSVVRRGPEAVGEAMRQLHAQGKAIAIADALDDEDLATLGEACAEWPLVTAGSGLAPGLAAAWARRGWLRPDAAAAVLAPMRGAAAVIAGSCSPATRAQVRDWLQRGHMGIRLDPLALHEGRQTLDAVLGQARAGLAHGPVLVYATDEPARVAAVQEALGMATASTLTESALAHVARGLVDGGVRRLVVAGGETSGAVVQALGVQRLRIGPAICPGVPWTEAVLPDASGPLHLALKSGNFGGPAFFHEALAMGGTA
jgi:uncharacterized protein YgbK (DUF1537 family)